MNLTRMNSNGIPCPCTRECKERAAGCAIGCAAWKEYEAARNALYEQRAKETKMRDFSERRARQWQRNLIGAGAKYAKRR